jgi:hypothetical protein
LHRDSYKIGPKANNKNRMMRAILYIGFISCLVHSVSAQKIDQCTICGKYYKLLRDKDFSTSYTIELKADSTFKLSIKIFEGRPQCEGKWKFIGEKLILLKCYEDNNPFEALTNGYMSQKEHTIQIINKNRIKFNDFVLRRKE